MGPQKNHLGDSCLELLSYAHVRWSKASVNLSVCGFNNKDKSALVFYWGALRRA